MQKYLWVVITFFLVSACATALPSPVKQDFRDQFRISKVDVIFANKSDIDDVHSYNVRSFVDRSDNARLNTELEAFVGGLSGQVWLGRGEADKFFAFLVVEEVAQRTAATWSGERTANLHVYVDGIAIPNALSGAVFGDFLSAITRYEIIEEATGERIAWRDKKNMLMIGNDDSTPVGDKTTAYSNASNTSVSSLVTIASMVSNEIVSALNASIDSRDMGDVEINDSVLLEAN